VCRLTRFDKGRRQRICRTIRQPDGTATARAIRIGGSKTVKQSRSGCRTPLRESPV
jgi:hypothetical protein